MSPYLATELEISHHYGHLRTGNDENDEDDEKESKEIVELILPNGLAVVRTKSLMSTN